MYTIERSDSEICLRRYNKKHKMWVNLFFPRGKTTDEDSIIETLSNLYIERMLSASREKTE